MFGFAADHSNESTAPSSSPHYSKQSSIMGFTKYNLAIKRYGAARFARRANSIGPHFRTFHSDVGPDFGLDFPRHMHRSM